MPGMIARFRYFIEQLEPYSESTKLLFALQEAIKNKHQDWNVTYEAIYNILTIANEHWTTESTHIIEPIVLLCEENLKRRKDLCSQILLIIRYYRSINSIESSFLQTYLPVFQVMEETFGISKEHLPKFIKEFKYKHLLELVKAIFGSSPELIQMLQQLEKKPLSKTAKVHSIPLINLDSGRIGSRIAITPRTHSPKTPHSAPSPESRKLVDTPRMSASLPSTPTVKIENPFASIQAISPHQFQPSELGYHELEYVETVLFTRPKSYESYESKDSHSSEIAEDMPEELIPSLNAMTTETTVGASNCDQKKKY